MDTKGAIVIATPSATAWNSMLRQRRREAAKHNILIVQVSLQCCPYLVGKFKKQSFLITNPKVDGGWGAYGLAGSANINA